VLRARRDDVQFHRKTEEREIEATIRAWAPKRTISIKAWSFGQIRNVDNCNGASGGEPIMSPVEVYGIVFYLVGWVITIFAFALANGSYSRVVLLDKRVRELEARMNLKEVG
jgi:hypothetical protein